MNTALMSYINSRFEDPKRVQFSTTYWGTAANGTFTFSRDHTADGAKMIYAFMFMANSVATQPFSLVDGMNSVLFPAININVSQFIQVPLQHVYVGSIARFTVAGAGVLAFSIGYQYIFEKRKTE